MTQQKKTGQKIPSRPRDRSRVSKIKETQREEVRKKFKGIEYVRQLEEIGEELSGISKQLAKVSSLKLKLTKADKEKLKAIEDQIWVLTQRKDVLRQRADLNFRRLKFVLPELRSVEMTDPEGKNPFKPLADVLRQALEDNE